MLYKPFTTKYTKKIIDDIKEYLEATNKDQTTLDTLDLCHLLGEIERLNNIIKEVREYTKNETWFSRKDLLEILDKEKDNE